MLRLKFLKRYICFVFLGTLLVPGIVYAQEKVSFNLSPTTIEQKVNPGDKIELSLTVENRGDVPTVLYPTSRNILRIGSDHQPVYDDTPNANSYELASWLQFSETELDVAPGQRAVLHFVVQFPDDASPGSHLAGLFLTQRPPEGVKQGSAVGVEIGAILHFQITGAIVENTRIREFQSDKAIYGSPNVHFMLRVENLGNTMSRPQGLIDITDMFGKKVDSLKVNETAFVVSPDSTSDYEIAWEPEGFVFGHFEAVVAMAVPLIDGGNQTISSVTQFWVLPLNIIMPVLGGLFTFILVLYVLIRLYVRRQLAVAGLSAARAVRETRGISRLAAVAIGLLFAVVAGLIILFFFFG